MPYNHNSIIEDVVNKKKKKAPPLSPTFGNALAPVDSNDFDDPPGYGRDQTAREFFSSPTGPEVKVENQQGNMFTARKVSPAAVAPALTGNPTPTGATGNPEYDAAYQKYSTEMKRGPQKQGVASQILFQIAEGMSNFSRGMQGQPMKPFQWLGEAKDERRDAAATKEFAPHEIERQRQRQLEMDRSKQTAANAEAQTKVLEAIRAVNPALGKQLDHGINSGYVPPELAKTASQMGYGTVQPMDTRQREYEQRGEKTLSRPKGDSGQWTEEQQLTDPSKRQIERELPTGEKFFTTGDKEADRVAQTSLNQARLDLDAQRITRDQLDDYERKMESWAKDSQGNNEKITSLNADAESFKTKAAAKREQAKMKGVRAGQIADDDPKEAARLRDEADALEVEARGLDKDSDAARSKAGSIKNRPAPKMSGGKVNTPQLSTGTKKPKTVSMSDLQRLSKQTGKSVDELRKMAEAEKYTIK